MADVAHVGRSLRLPAACALLLLLAWGGVVNAPFVADDYSHLAQALGEHGPEDIRVSLIGSWHDRGPPWFWRPLAVITFVVDGMLYGPHPTGFHVTQFALFLVTALLLGAAARSLLGQLGVEDRLVHAAGAIAALQACVLPSQLEAIAWISNRDGPLANLFGLAALVCVLRGRRALAALAALLALASKETAVAWVALAALAQWIMTRRKTGIVTTWPFVLLLAAYFAARFAMFGTFGTGQVALALVDSERGAFAVAANVLAWLRFVPWPAAPDLLSWLAAPAGIACALLFLAPFVLAHAGSPGARRATWSCLLVAGVVAIVLLGPITFVVPSPADLRNTRFVPLVALPLSVAIGFAWAVALAGRFRSAARWLLAGAISVQVAVAALHAASFALVARDLEHVRDVVRGALKEHSIDPAQTPVLFTILDPPREGPAEFSLMNAFHGLLMAPVTPVDIPVGALSSDELAVARLVPEIRPRFETNAFLLPPGPPIDPARPLERVARRLARFERLGLTEPCFVHRERPAAASLPATPPFAALDVAALEIDVPADHSVVAVEWTGTRGSGRFVGSATRSPLIAALETAPDWLAAGDVTRIVVRAGRDEVPARVTPLSRLPEIAVLAPGAEFALADDPRRRVEIAFSPPFPCARWRVRVVPSLAAMLTDTFDAAQLPPDASGVIHARFTDGAMNGARTALDWRFVRATATGDRVRWFVEGVDDDARVVARSRLAEMRLAVR